MDASTPGLESGGCLKRGCLDCSQHRMSIDSAEESVGLAFLGLEPDDYLITWAQQDPDHSVVLRFNFAGAVHRDEGAWLE